jgi:hypothetical protein
MYVLAHMNCNYPKPLNSNLSYKYCVQCIYAYMHMYM